MTKNAERKTLQFCQRWWLRVLSFSTVWPCLPELSDAPRILKTNFSGILCEKAKKDAIKENKANHLMLEMDDCVKGKLMEPGRCTMERFKEIYTKCEKGIIGEIKEFIENDETVHQLFHFAHEN